MNLASKYIFSLPPDATSKMIVLIHKEKKGYACANMCLTSLFLFGTLRSQYFSWDSEFKVRCHFCNYIQMHK